METLFCNKKIEIWVKSTLNQTYAITVHDPSLAWVLNSILAHYPARHKFEKGEEPTFPFSSNQIESIGRRSRFMQKTLAQTFRA